MCRRSAWPPRASGPGCRWTRSPRRSGRAGCRSPSWRPQSGTGGVRCARHGPTGRSARRPGCRWSCFAEPWSRRALPGRLRTTRCGRTSWRWWRCCRRWLATGILDLAWMTRIGRAWADGLRLAAKAESEAYHARVRVAGVGVRHGSSGGPGAVRRARPRARAAAGPGGLGHLPPPAGAGLDRGPGRARRGGAGGGRRPHQTRAGPGDVLPGPGRLHPTHRGAGRPGSGRAGRVAGGAGATAWPASTVGCRPSGWAMG